MLVGIVIPLRSPDALIRMKQIPTRIIEGLQLLLSNRVLHLVSAVMCIVTEKAARSVQMPGTISKLL